MNEDDQICSTEFVVWRTPRGEIKNYLYMVATSQWFIAFCTKSATGTSNSHKRVNPKVMMSFKLPFCHAVAVLLGERLEPMLKKVIMNQAENIRLSELRDWLLPMLMNGQVIVKDS
jgi:type I restriction enzyme S subunit